MHANLSERSRNLALFGSVLFLLIVCVLIVMRNTLFPATHKKLSSLPLYSSMAFQAAPLPPPPQPAPVEPPPKASPPAPPPKPQAAKIPPPKKQPPRKPVPEKKPVPKKVKIPPPQKIKNKQTPPPQKPVDTAVREAVAASPAPVTTKKTVETPPQPAPPPASPRPTQAETDRAIQEVVAAIERHKKYPKAARRAGYGGLVKLRIRLSPDGVVTRCSMEKSSGRNKLDEAALKAAEKILHQKVTSVALPEELVVSVPVRFFLKER